MARVPLEDHFSSTDDIQGYARIHSDSRQVSEELKSSFSPLSGKKDERRALGESTNPHSRQEAEGCPGHTCQGAHHCRAILAWRHQRTWNVS